MTELLSADPTDEPLPVKVYDAPLIHTETPPEPAKINNSIDFTIESSITLLSFVIDQILIIPSTSASLTITITTTKSPIVRTVHLQGTAYTSWGEDDSYLYDYIRENIKSIY